MLIKYCDRILSLCEETCRALDELQTLKKQREQETLEEYSEEEMDEDSDDEGSENEMDEDSDDEDSENEMDEDSDDDDHLDRWEELRSHSKDTA